MSSTSEFRVSIFGVTSLNSTEAVDFTLDPGRPNTDGPVVPVYLDRFNKWYQGIHGYFSIVVCLFGILSNIINIVVLTRRSMSTPTNCILTAIAVADMLTMLSYLPYATYFYCITALEQKYGHPRGWIVYMIFHFNFTITCHTVAMWLTVVLAVFRYVVVCRRLHSPPTLCSLPRARMAVGAIALMSTALCLPTYVLYRPDQVDDPPDTYWVDLNPFVTQLYVDINFWLFGVVLKVAPCILLSVLSILLIRTMRRAGRNRRRLRSHSAALASSARRGSDRTGASSSGSVDSDHNRTTWMLVAVVLSFVAAELPQGVIALLSGINNAVFEMVYVPLGDIWDILVLVNSAVNFVLYCTMSRQYRTTFRQIFCQRLTCVSGGKTSAAGGRSSVSNARNGVAYTMINLRQTSTLVVR